MVHHEFFCLLMFSLLVIFGAFSWDFRGKDLEVFLYGICVGNRT
jgi:hypothetical protein